MTSIGRNKRKTAARLMRKLLAGLVSLAMAFAALPMYGTAGAPEGAETALAASTPSAYLSDLSVATKQNGDPAELTPAFDGAIGDYSFIMEDTSTSLFVTPRLSEAGAGAAMKVVYVNTYNATREVAVEDGATARLFNVRTGDSPEDVQVSVKVAKDGNEETYDLTGKIKPSLSALTATALGADVELGESGFSANVFDYTCSVPASADSITVSPVARMSGCAVTVNGTALSAGSADVPLSGDETNIPIEVRTPAGLSTGYTIRVMKAPALALTFDLTPADAVVVLKDSRGHRVWPDAQGGYGLIGGKDYSYAVTKNGYCAVTGTVNGSGELVKEISLIRAPENPGIDADLQAAWPFFRGTADNNGVTQAKTPASAGEAVCHWAAKLGSGYQTGAPGCPILADGYLYTYVGNNIVKIDSMTGKTVATGEMATSSSFAINSPSYAAGMIFVGLSNGTVQAFNAKTLESLWIYHDAIRGQPNCPIAYADGYIYTGFWQGESAAQDFVCLPVADEDPENTMEEKQAAWTHTGTGFYWAGAYAGTGSDGVPKVIVGSENGTSSDADSGILLSFDPRTGRVLDQIKEGFNGDIRSSVVWDSETDRYYFTTKGGKFCSVKVNPDGTFDHGDVRTIQLENGTTGTPMSTSSPVIKNGRAYIGVSGKAQFTEYSGHNITVIDLSSNQIAYRVETQGYPQTSGLLTTARLSEDGYVYVYFVDNYTPGKVRYVKDRPGLTEPASTTVETDSKGVSHEVANVLFTPYGAQEQYAICSPVADDSGCMYFKNDSSYMMMVGPAIDRLQVRSQPDKTRYIVGDPFEPEGMEIEAVFRNGAVRDVTASVKGVSETVRSGSFAVELDYDGNKAMYHDSNGQAGVPVTSVDSVQLGLVVKTASAYREMLVEELRGYLDLNNYRVQEAVIINGIIRDADDEMKTLSHSGEMDAVAENARAALDEVPTEEEMEALSGLREEKKEELRNYKDPADYRAAERQQLEDAVEEGAASIDTAATEEEILQALADAKEAIDAIKTAAEYEAEELAEAKRLAKIRIGAYLDLTKYREEDIETINGIIAAGEETIDAAENIDGLNAVLAEILADLDGVPTSEERDAQEFEELKETSKDEIRNYKSPDDYREAEQALLAQAVQDGIDAVDAARTVNAVNRAVRNAKKAIDEIKTAQQYLDEELAEIKSSAKEEIAAYVGAIDRSLYRQGEIDRMDEIREECEQAIDDALTEEEIASAVADAKDALDALKTDAELTEEEEEERRKQQAAEDKQASIEANAAAAESLAAAETALAEAGQAAGEAAEAVNQAAQAKETYLAKKDKEEEMTAVPGDGAVDYAYELKALADAWREALETAQSKLSIASGKYRDAAALAEQAAADAESAVEAAEASAGSALTEEEQELAAERKQTAETMRSACAEQAETLAAAQGALDGQITETGEAASDAEHASSEAAALIRKTEYDKAELAAKAAYDAAEAAGAELEEAAGALAQAASDHENAAAAQERLAGEAARAIAAADAVKEDGTQEAVDAALDAEEKANAAKAGADETQEKAEAYSAAAETCREKLSDAKALIESAKEAAQAALEKAVTEEEKEQARERIAALAGASSAAALIEEDTEAHAAASAHAESAAAEMQQSAAGLVSGAAAVKQAAETAKAEKDEEERRREEEEREKRKDVDEITPSDVTAEEAPEDGALRVSGVTSSLNVSRKKLTVKWNASQGALNYRVAWRKAGAAAWTEAWSKGKTSHTIFGLAAGGAYEVRVRAFARTASVEENGGIPAWRKSGWSVTVRRFLRTSKVKKFKAAKKAVTVKLAKAAGATGYRIRYSLKKNMKGAKTKTAGKASVKITKLRKGKRYFFTVTPIRKYKGKIYTGEPGSKKRSPKIR